MWLEERVYYLENFLLSESLLIPKICKFNPKIVATRRVS